MTLVFSRTVRSEILWQGKLYILIMVTGIDPSLGVAQLGIPAICLAVTG
jgi:hypothetical protein